MGNETRYLSSHEIEVYVRRAAEKATEDFIPASPEGVKELQARYDFAARNARFACISNNEAIDRGTDDGCDA